MIYSIRQLSSSVTKLVLLVFQRSLRLVASTMFVLTLMFMTGTADAFSSINFDRYFSPGTFVPNRGQGSDLWGVHLDKYSGYSGIRGFDNTGLAAVPQVNNIDQFVQFYWETLNRNVPNPDQITRYGDITVGGVYYPSVDSGHTIGDNAYTQAAFVILNMMGYPPKTTPKNTALTVFSQWEARVRSYATAGLISFNVERNFTVNTLYDIRVDDVVRFGQTASAHAVVFWSPDGTSSYVIKRDCANPLGSLTGLPSLQPASIRGVREPTDTLTPTDVNNLRIRSRVGPLTVAPVENNAPEGSPYTMSIPYGPGSIKMYNSPIGVPETTHEVRYRWALCPSGGCSNDAGAIINFIESSGASWSGWGNPAVSFSYSTAQLPMGRQMALHVQYRPVVSVEPPPVIVDARKPYFRVYGGNVVTGTSCGGVTYPAEPTSLPRVISWNNSGNGGGSATTHGVLSLGSVEEFASAAGRTNIPTPLKGLTFANSGTTYYGGGLDVSHAPCLGSYFEVPEGATPLESGAITFPTQPDGVYYVNGNLNLTAGTNYGTKKITIYVEGDVIIENNIRNALSVGAGVGSLSDLPRLIVIARNIIIRHNVSEIAGIFIAEPSDPSEGNILTCDVGTADPSDEGLTTHIGSVCRSQLAIHGSLIASRLKLIRSAGDYEDPEAQNNERHNSGDAAERIIYSPEVWLPNASSGNVKLKSTYDSFTAMPPIL